MMEVRFGDWLPELSDYKNPGLEVCENAIPRPDGYQPARAAVGVGESVSGTIIGAMGYTRSSGVQGVCVATTSDIYTIINNTVTASGLGLSLSSADRVVFEQFGPSIYATSKRVGTYSLLDIEADYTFAAGTGSPPTADAMGRISDFLVMGSVIDLDGVDRPSRIRWSRFNDPDSDWSTDIAYQSGAVTLGVEQGNVTHISGGDFGLVFQERGISRLTYTGGASVFGRELFEKNRGSQAPDSVVRIGPLAYFLSHDGFFVTDGSSVQSISRGRIWTWFKDNVNAALVSRTQGGVDWANRCVVWSFPASSGEEKTHQLYFNWESNRWSVVARQLDYIVVSGRSAETLESVAVTYPDIDVMSLSLDSPLFRESGRALMGFSGNELSTLDGAALKVCFETGDFQPIVGRRAFVDTVTPLIENADANTTVSLGSRDQMISTITYTPEQAIGGIGYAPFNVDGRYNRVRVCVPAGSDWSNAYGFQVTARASGMY